MESKGINSPYAVALISGLVLGFSCEFLAPLTELDGSSSFWDFLVPFIVLILFFAVIQQVLRRFWGFQGFVFAGDNGKGKRVPSYLMFFVGYFGSRLLVAVFTIMFFDLLPN